MFYLVLVVAGLVLAVATPFIVRTKEEIQAFRTFLESTQTHNPTQFLLRSRINPLANPEEISGKYQGDILLDDFMIDMMVQQYAIGRNAFTLEGSKWPNNTVVWEFGKGEFDPSQKQAIMKGIEDIESHTCIKFRRREPKDTIFVRVTGRYDGCYADYPGYWDRRPVSRLNLARDVPGQGCFRHTTIVHEWMHILGFYHMQSTYNRDDYIKILEKNIIPSRKHNFVIHSNADNLGVEYDYVSCLHYGPYAFSRNGRKTIVAVKKYKGKMGQRTYVTDNDWLRINRRYNCPGAWN